MKALTSQELDSVCNCGHQRREHADDIEANETINEASEECMNKSGGYYCGCKKFASALEDVFVIHEVSNGIFTGKAIVSCSQHGKCWKEGDNFEDFGGKACKECCLSKNRKDVVTKHQ